MATDRLQFDTVELSNGVVFHGKQWDVPFVDMRITVPVGHAHCTGEFLPGSAHILEHAATRKSEVFPGDRSFDKFVSDAAGDANAWSAITTSGFRARVPVKDWQMTLRGLLSQAVNPILTDDIVKIECDTIAQESKRISRWYPADNELGHYMNTKWRYDRPLDLRQMYGNKGDRKAMNASNLAKLQRLYLRKGFRVLIGGSFDQAAAIKILDDMVPKLVERDYPVLFKQRTWKRREYHARSFDDIQRYAYYVSVILDSMDIEERLFAYLLDSYLIDFTYGALYLWLRHERQWTYELHSSIRHEAPLKPIHGLHIPLGKKEHVAVVRQELFDRIAATVADDDAMNRAVDRFVGSSVFTLQRLGDAFEAAETMLDNHGQIFTENETMRTVERFRDRTLRRRLFERVWDPAKVGEFLAMPANA